MIGVDATKEGAEAFYTIQAVTNQLHKHFITINLTLTQSDAFIKERGNSLSVFLLCFRLDFLNSIL